ncbi:MAG TPA: type II CAAX endopeptidase family protein [Anaerolineales bacterium]|nr:type II CAAX endopeptidase family protein [Anaerolineales bacterium]
MKKIISTYPLSSFFIMAIAFTWIAVMPLLLNPGLPVEPFMIIGALAGPTLSAVIAIAITEGKAALVAFFKRYLQGQAGIIWWLIVLFGILLSLNVVASLILGSSIWTEFFKNAGLILPTYLITLIVGVILGPLWEEPGWRGFALPRLQEQYGPFMGSITLGLIWAVWHAPGYLGGWMLSTVPALLVYSIGFSILATWVYNNSRGSILLMILLHSSSNAAISVGARVLPTDLSPALHAFVYSGWIPAIMGGVIAILLLVFTKGRLGYSKTI